MEKPKEIAYGVYFVENGRKFISTIERATPFDREFRQPGKDIIRDPSEALDLAWSLWRSGHAPVITISHYFGATLPRENMEFSIKGFENYLLEEKEREEANKL